jgi:hypothetical protein
MLRVRGRTLLQLGGAGRTGWITRTVADSEDQALEARDLMVADYLQDGYQEVPWDESAWPPVPGELFDPEYDEAS